ncbi:hypothetical protein [Halomonas sp. NO4]|uniref:hypothetical protein n=1 Tax=Halomonas sp. NO4 TaxID=2484813 RepID=UPI0013D3287D|nr:hypothetical protein [Halomonas sp. NO4]
MGQHQQFAPGMRLEILDAEWRLTRLDHSRDGGYLLGCTGLSMLVRGREAQFLSRLEDDIRILDPATTELVDDLSQGYRAGLLNLATQLRDTAPTDERIHLGHHAAMDALKARHQQQIELDLAASREQEARKQRRREERTAQLERVFDDYLDWLEATQQIEPRPWLQVAAIFTGDPASPQEAQP